MGFGKFLVKFLKKMFRPPLEILTKKAHTIECGIFARRGSCAVHVGAIIPNVENPVK